MLIYKTEFQLEKENQEKRERIFNLLCWSVIAGLILTILSCFVGN